MSSAKHKDMICVICPNGCNLQVYYKEPDTVNALEILEVQGHLCKKGPPYAHQELISPRRTIATSVLVEGGDFPLVSVRTDRPIPLASIQDIVKEIKRLTLKAPIKVGEVLLERPLGLDVNIIATREVRAR